MKRLYFVCLFLCFTTTFLLSQSNPVPLVNQNARAVSPVSASQADPKAQAKILDSYGKLPLSFEANHGQTDTQVKFLSRTSGYTLFLTGDEAVFSLSGKKASTNKAKIVDMARSPQSSMAAAKPSGVLRMKFRNANPAAKVTGTDELAGTSNYFIGNDPKKWRTNVPTFAKVKYERIYSGIDLVYYGNQRQLEYDFIVAPGADPHRISFDVRGAKSIRQDGNGELVFKVGGDEIRWHKPVVYQENNGTRQEIAAHYAITNTNRVEFEMAKYDASRTLYIDPLIYSTYLGGSGTEIGYGIAVDSSGNAYVAGFTNSADFPTTPGAFQTTYGGGNVDAFVAKLNSAGSALVYSTYLGGNGAATGDVGQAIAVDSSGNAYVSGYTASTNFPVTPGAFQTTCGSVANCFDAFVAKLNPTGSALVYSTYLGGGGIEFGGGIAVDHSGNAYVTGYTTSTDFPVTPGAFQTTCDGCGNNSFNAFVTRLNPTGSALVYSTYLGGSGRGPGGQSNGGNGIAVDKSGDAYVTGFTNSTNFPVTPGAFQTTCGNPSSCVSAFVAEFNSTGSALVYSTYLGGSGGEVGSGEYGFGIAVDSSGNAYVAGSANSTDFPTTPGAFQRTCGNPTQCGNAFVSKFNPTGSALMYSTYLGGSGTENGVSIVVDSSGDAYVTGNTSSTDFPVTPDAFQTALAGYENAFVSKFNPTGSALIYSTYLGGSNVDGGQGIAVDSSDNAYVTGSTSSTDFPVTPGAFQTNFAGGNGDAFVTKFARQSGPYGVVSPAVLTFQVPVGHTSPQQRVSLKNTGDSELTVSDISISVNFAITINHCANGIKPGTHCDVYVTFTPPGPGRYTGILTFVDNASNSPQTASLTGNGLTSSCAGPNILPIPAPVTFYFTQGWAKITSSGDLRDSFSTANGCQSMEAVPDDFAFTNGIVQCVNGCSTADALRNAWSLVQFTPPGDSYQMGWGWISADTQNVTIGDGQLNVSGSATGSASFLPCVWQGPDCIDTGDTWILDAQFNYTADFTGGPDEWYLQDAYISSPGSKSSSTHRSARSAVPH